MVCAAIKCLTGKAKLSTSLLLIASTILRKSHQTSQQMSSIEPVVVGPRSGNHSASIIFLHGLGDTGHGWSDTLSELAPPHVKLICPTAPTIPVTLNFGMSMPAWFDLYSLSGDGRQDIDGLKKSADAIGNLIEEEITKHNIPANRILIGGFSMGGALSLHTALRYPKTLAGVLALSCWLPSHKEYPAAFNQDNKALKILQCHGESDPMVPYGWGQATADLLKPLVTSFSFKAYPGMGHSSCSEEMRDAAKFIAQVLPPQ